MEGSVGRYKRLVAASKIITILLLFGLLKANAQKQYNVLDWKADVSLNTYLVQQMRLQYQDRRNKFHSALESKIKTLAYVKTVKEKAKEVFGALPKKAQLNPEITGEIQQEGYRIEKIIYQSFENHHVTANLYVPNGDGKFPAVLLFCGHEDVSKATESYQKTAILLAKNGFVVFVIDPISQSERVQLTDETGKSLTRGATTEHTLLNLSSNLLGTSVAAYELFDNQRGLDYLMTRKEVDTTKIGAMGNSGGGMQTIYFAAMDDRVKAFAPCSYLASRENTLATTGAADGCAQIPNEGANLLEMADYLIAAAPKPTLILAGRYDFIDYNGTLEAYADLEKVYAKLQASHKLSLFTYDDGHGISKPKREKAVQWFRKWFYNDDSTIIESNSKVLTDVELFTTEKNKVNLSYANEITVQKYNQKLFEEYDVYRDKFRKSTFKEKQQTVQKLLNIGLGNTAVSVEYKGEVQGKYATFRKKIIRKDKEVPIPILVYYPQKAVKRVVLWLSDEGKSNLVDSAALMQYYLAQEDVAVVFADLRGFGETADKPELNDPKYFSKDYRNAMLALHIGKPLLGQRTTDVLTLMKYLSKNEQTQNLPIEINAEGNVGLAVIHAAFFNQDIKAINLYQGVNSYQQVLGEPLAKDRYGLVLNNVLSFYDIPDLIRSIETVGIKVVH